MEDNKTTDESVLVVCTAGQHRSPTAARLLEEQFGIAAKACGIHPQASQPVTQELIDWSDHIIAMDERTDGHKSYLKDRFDIGDRSIYVFDIPDVYSKDDPDLISLLKEKTQVFVERVESLEA